MNIWAASSVNRVLSSGVHWLLRRWTYSTGGVARLLAKMHFRMIARLNAEAAFGRLFSAKNIFRVYRRQLGSFGPCALSCARFCADLCLGSGLCGLPGYL